MSRNKKSGFTIVELLVVIVVIAILATISVVAFNGVQDRTRLSMVQSDLKNAKKKLMLYDVDNGHYPASGPELLVADVSISSVANYNIRSDYSNFYYCLDKVNNEFSIGVRVAGSGTPSFYITSSENITPRTGLMSQSGTCSLLGLSGTTEAQGAFSSSGLSAAGTTSSWLKTN